MKVESIEQFQAIINKEKELLFFKNSLTCPISQKAFQEFQSFVKDHPNLPAYYLHVQEARELSNYIADFFQVKHESPQVLFINEQAVCWHISHWNITYQELENKLAK